jgi:reactive chlorine resistance protein C
MTGTIPGILDVFVRTERLGPVLMRLAIAIVFLWIGALKLTV